MAFPERTPSIIALELLNCIDQNKGRATKWDLIKILGNESQFQLWVTEFLLKDRLIEEKVEYNHHLYGKTETGELFHKLLRTAG